MSEQLADWTVPDDGEPEADRFEEQAAFALASAARDLASRGWTPHDLANLVAEAVSANPPSPTEAELAALANLLQGGDPFA